MCGKEYFLNFLKAKLLLSNVSTLYAGTVKSHNVCKCHVAIDTGFKQTEHIPAN